MIANLEKLSPEYDRLFDSCVPTAEHKDEIEDFAFHVTAGKTAYIDIQEHTGVPWYVVGLIHGMECTFNFGQHLHNGDSLRRRTVNDPGGRPPTGTPPFTFVASAVDALAYDHFTDWHDWSLPGICFKLEGYNGWGYRNHAINSPYLWSYSNHYERGKYVADGHWDRNAVSRQVGAIVALKHLALAHEVALPGYPAA